MFSLKVIEISDSGVKIPFEGEGAPKAVGVTMSLIIVITSDSFSTNPVPKAQTVTALN